MVAKCEVNSDSASAMQNVISKYFSMVPLRESSDFLYSYSAHRDFFRKTKGGRNADLSKYPSGDDTRCALRYVIESNARGMTSTPFVDGRWSRPLQRQ